MSDSAGHQPGDQLLLEQIEKLLADSSRRDDPLYRPLAELFKLCRGQRERLERLVRISDGYHSLSRHQVGTLNQRYDRQLRRLEKLSRISDRYQEMMRQFNESLQKAALHDPLTGLGNRRFLLEHIKAETLRFNRCGQVFSIAVLDVDHFKRVNDTYGHEAGDQLLCEIARTIPTVLREYDICGRWGGEEFLLIFPSTDPEAATQIAQRIRQAIAAITLPFFEDRHHITASLGLTTYRQGEDHNDTIRRADDAMYQAKAAGRDRVHTA